MVFPFSEPNLRAVGAVSPLEPSKSYPAPWLRGSVRDPSLGLVLVDGELMQMCLFPTHRSSPPSTRPSLRSSVTWKRRSGGT